MPAAAWALSDSPMAMQDDACAARRVSSDSALAESRADGGVHAHPAVHASMAQLRLKGEDRCYAALGGAWPACDKRPSVDLTRASAGGPATWLLDGDGVSGADVLHLAADEGGQVDRLKAHGVRAAPASEYSLFAVFDGHNGPDAAQHCTDEVWELVRSRLPPGLPPLGGAETDDDDPAACAWRGALQAALAGAFHELQHSWASRGRLGGTTATVVLLCGRLATVANVGDSLGLLDTGASVMPLTGDHRVHNSKREQDRVRAAGGTVTNIDASGSGPSTDPKFGLGPLRIWPGGVANARAVGDFDVPGFLLPCPHVTQVVLPAEGARVVIASDGIWDSVDIHRAAKVARPLAAPEAADRIVLQALRAQGGVPKDDATVVVIDVLPPGVPSFPEATGKKLKRSVSRAAALAAAGVVAPESDGERSRGESPARGRGGGGAKAAPAPPPAGGGLFGCCASTPATTGDDPPSPARRDRSVRGGGYGPSVRGGSAFLGAVPDSRPPSGTSLAPPDPEDSAHSATSAAAALGGSQRGGTAFGRSSDAPSRPRVCVLAAIDVAVLLDHLPPAPADAAATHAAAAWCCGDVRDELLRLQAAAHEVYASKCGSRQSFKAPAALDLTQHPVRRPEAVPGEAGEVRRTGPGPTPVVCVPALSSTSGRAELAVASRPSPVGPLSVAS